MDYLSFIAEMTKALAWPLSAVAIALALRRPLQALLSSIRSLKYSDIELTFEHRLAVLSRQADITLPDLPQRPSELLIKDQLLSLAGNAPVEAVVEGWRYLETQLIGSAKAQNLKVAPAVWAMPMVLGALLYKEGHLSESQMSLLRRARVLRHEVTTQPPETIEPAAAEAFVKLVVRLAASLDPQSSSNGK